MRVIATAALVLIFLPGATARSAEKRGDIKTSPNHVATQNTQGANDHEHSADVAPQWDPVTCWDCETPYETEGMFFVGVLFAIPVSVWVIRRKTRKIESLPPKRYFEI
jgi:hypothetical protein